MFILLQISSLQWLESIYIVILGLLEVSTSTTDT